MRRFVEVRDGVKFIVLDLKNPENPIIVCKTEGFNAPHYAEYIAAALQHYHDHLIAKVLPDGIFEFVASDDTQGGGSDCP